MKKLLPLTLAILALARTSSACAEDSWYLGALYNAQDISSDDREFNTAGIITGYQYNKYFALEARLNTGVSGYSTSLTFNQASDINYKEDIDSQASLSIKLSYPIDKSINLYVLAGYTTTKIKMNRSMIITDSNGAVIFPYDFKTTYSGSSYGVGLNYQLNERFNLFIDYQVLPDFDPVSNYSKNWKSTNIGVNYSF
jgi:opacity protein-like surface antigen